MNNVNENLSGEQPVMPLIELAIRVAVRFTKEDAWFVLTPDCSSGLRFAGDLRAMGKSFSREDYEVIRVAGLPGVGAFGIIKKACLSRSELRRLAERWRLRSPVLTDGRDVLILHHNQNQGLNAAHWFQTLVRDGASALASRN